MKNKNNKCCAKTIYTNILEALLNTKIVDQNGLNVTPGITRCSNTFKIKQMSSELIKHKKSWISYIEIPALFIVFNLVNERYIAILHDTIIANASKKNMPLNSAKSIDWLKYDFNATRTANKPTKINMNAFDGFINICSPFISNLVVLIRKIEKISPILIASTISNDVNRNSGKSTSLRLYS